MSSPSQIPMLLAGEESPNDSLDEIVTDGLLTTGQDKLNTSGNSSDHELLKAEAAGGRESPVVLDSVHINVDLGKRAKEPLVEINDNAENSVDDAEARLFSNSGCSPQVGLPNSESNFSKCQSFTNPRFSSSYSDVHDQSKTSNADQVDTDRNHEHIDSPTEKITDNDVSRNELSTDVAVLTVHHTIHDKNGMVETSYESQTSENKDSNSEANQPSHHRLHRQSKVDDAQSQPTLSDHSQRYPKDSQDIDDNNDAKPQDVTVEIETSTKVRPPLRPSASLAHEKPVNEIKARLRQEGQRSHSLEVPSININYVDDMTPEDNLRKRHHSADDSFSGASNRSLQDDMESVQNPPDITHSPDNTEETNEIDSKTHSPLPSVAASASIHTPLSFNHAHRHLLTKSVGRSGGEKLRGSYSLDVPGVGSPKHSLSMTTLEVKGQQELKRPQFPVVEDKLISSSLSRLEGVPGQRRRSWTPDNTPRGSKSSIYGDELESHKTLMTLPSQPLTPRVCLS